MSTKQCNLHPYIMFIKYLLTKKQRYKVIRYLQKKKSYKVTTTVTDRCLVEVGVVGNLTE